MQFTGTTGRSVVLCMALMLTVGACGGDENDDAEIGAGGAGPVDSAAPRDDARDDVDTDDGVLGDNGAELADPSDGDLSGQGTLTIDGQLFITDNTFCDISDVSPTEVAFNYFGTGTTDGKPFTVAVSIVSTVDGGGGTTIVDSVAVSQTAPSSVLWVTPAVGTDRAASEFSIDGRSVSYGGDLIEPIGEAVGRASFFVTCP